MSHRTYYKSFLPTALGAVVLAVLSSPALSHSLSLSKDNGLTWVPNPDWPPSEDLPWNILLSAGDTAPRPTLHVPRCVVEGALQVKLIGATPSTPPFGLRLERAAGCDGGVVGGRERGVGKVLKQAVPRLRPDWLEFVQDGAKIREDRGEKIEAKRGVGSRLFGKYGLYIMGFIGIALFQGIRKGIAELHAEAEREEMDKAERRVRGRAQTGQVRVVVPKRKASKGKRKVTVRATAT